MIMSRIRETLVVVTGFLITVGVMFWSSTLHAEATPHCAAIAFVDTPDTTRYEVTCHSGYRIQTILEGRDSIAGPARPILARNVRH
jgi:hypothetical protein